MALAVAPPTALIDEGAFEEGGVGDTGGDDSTMGVEARHPILMTVREGTGARPGTACMK